MHKPTAIKMVSMTVLVLSIASAHSQRNSPVGGAGGMSCGDYLESRSKNSGPMNSLLQSWLLGYVSGYNQFSPNKIVNNIPDPPTLLAFVDKHCRNNPLHVVKWGADALIVELGGDVSSSSSPKR